MNKVTKYLLIISIITTLLAGCSSINSKKPSSPTPMPETTQTIEEHNPQILQQDNSTSNLPEPVNVDCSDIN
jgi:hypothetical protein